LWRAEGGYQELREAVPAREGDEVQVRFRAPAGMHVGLFAVNGRGELRLVQSYEPAATAHQAVHPGHERTRALVGPGGTEFVFVAGRRDGPVSEDQVRSLWEEQAGWPRLAPAKRLLRVRRDGVTEEGERPRDFGEVRERPEADPVRVRLERFAERLREAYPLLDGLAMRHEERR
jgi:hypothetical protein